MQAHSGGRKFQLALAAALVLCAGARTPLPGDEPDGGAALAKLLEVGWGATPAFRAAADAQLDEVWKVAGRNPDSLYAATVVLIKQSRYAEAQTHLDELLKLDPKHQEGWRAKIWLSALLKNHASALASAEKFAALLPTEETRTAEEQAALRKQLEFLGRMYGFFGGPAADSIKIDERKASERAILATLRKERAEMFEAARDGVLQKYIELTDAKLEQKAKAKVAAEEDLEKSRKELAGDRKQVAEREKELDAREDKLRQQLNAELAEMRKSDQPLVEQLGRLNSQAASLNQELLGITLQVNLYQQQLASSKDPNLRFGYQLSINRLAGIGNQLNLDLANVNRTARAVQQQRALLAEREQKALAVYQQETEQLNQEFGDLARREKRAEIAEKRLARPVSTTPRSALVLAAQASALTTYEHFPLEQEKLRLLESFK